MDFEVAPAVREVLSNALERSDWGVSVGPPPIGDPRSIFGENGTKVWVEFGS